ncbi:MAG: hypothetical protein WAK62_22580, partial [Terriglobales bacterium]
MKRWTACALFALVTVSLVFAQPSSTNQQTNQKTADPYQPTLNRLESLTSLPLSDWRTHADVPHPEDSSLDDSSWETMKVGDKWSTGSRVLRRWVDIPEKIDGYAVL